MGTLFRTALFGFEGGDWAMDHLSFTMEPGVDLLHGETVL